MPGRQGPAVSALGPGCMGMSEFYGPRNEAESIATLHRAPRFQGENSARNLALVQRALQGLAFHELGPRSEDALIRADGRGGRNDCPTAASRRGESGLRG